MEPFHHAAIESVPILADQNVQEALAAELVPIIWWFLTHCRLVEDDAPLPPSPPATTPLSPSTSLSIEREPSLRPDVLVGDLDVQALSDHVTSAGEESDAPITVPVQAFTPMLGTLLLSPNGIVGGSARYAVVELLRRLRRADQREDDEDSDRPDEPANPAPIEETRLSSPTPSQSEYQEAQDALEIGLFQRNERRLFERELIYQVVIGMGRLDMDDNRADQDMEGTLGITLDSGPSTAVPTPHPDPSAVDSDSYFPATAVSGLTASSVSSAPITSPPMPTAELAAFTTSALSPVPSPSPPVSSTSSLTSSPGHSSASTPSLTSSTSSSSGEYSDTAENSGTERFGLDLTDGLPGSDDMEVPMDVDEVSNTSTETLASPTRVTGPPEVKLPAPQNWTTSGALPRHAALPTTPPFEVPPPPSVAAPVPASMDGALPITGLPMLQVQAPSSSPVTEEPPRQLGGWMSPNSAARQLEE